MIISSRAPVRIDLAGGWTDVDIFARSAGGAVLNVTIDHYVEGRMDTGAPSYDPKAPDGLSGLKVAYESQLPASSGLGTSAALNVVWLSLLKPEVSTDEDRARIAELAFSLESMLGVLGGKQDQYAAAYGGLNLMTFGERAHVERLYPGPETMGELERRLVLCYTGKQRLSGSIHEKVWGAFQRGEQATVSALFRLRECAVRMRDEILSGDINRVAAIMGENWACQCLLDESVNNEQINRFFSIAMRAGALSGKACGAGGGGCLVFCTEAGWQESVSRALADAGSRVIPFRFESKGLEVSHSPA
jgi:D-glycero-alpha-D-manno-heptose-7-phosphate kinase